MADHVVPLWALDLLAAADLAAEEFACEPAPDHEEGCDRCAWERLAEAAPASVRALAVAVASRSREVVRGPDPWAPEGATRRGR